MLSRYLSLAVALMSLPVLACGGEEQSSQNGAVVNTVPGQPGWRPVSPPPESVCIGQAPEASAWALSEQIAEEQAARAAAAAEAEATAERRAEELNDAPQTPVDARPDTRPELSTPESTDEDIERRDAGNDLQDANDGEQPEVVEDPGDTETDTDASVEATADAQAGARFPDFQLPGIPEGDEADDGPSDPCSPNLDPSQCMGLPVPEFAAYDFQPQSCGYGATYGFEPFKGRVTLAVLLASW